MNTQINPLTIHIFEILRRPHFNCKIRFHRGDIAVDTIKQANSTIHNHYLPLNDDDIRKMLHDVAERLLSRFNIDINIQECMQEIQGPVDDASIYSSLLTHILGKDKK